MQSLVIRLLFLGWLGVFPWVPWSHIRLIGHPGGRVSEAEEIYAIHCCSGCGHVPIDVAKMRWSSFVTSPARASSSLIICKRNWQSEKITFSLSFSDFFFYLRLLGELYALDRPFLWRIAPFRPFLRPTFPALSCSFSILVLTFVCLFSAFRPRFWAGLRWHLPILISLLEPLHRFRRMDLLADLGFVLGDAFSFYCFV